MRINASHTERIACAGHAIPFRSRRNYGNDRGTVTDDVIPSGDGEQLRVAGNSVPANRHVLDRPSLTRTTVSYISQSFGRTFVTIIPATALPEVQSSRSVPIVSPFRVTE